MAAKGFRCYLGRKSYINYLIKNLNGYIYIDKGYHKGVSENIYESVKKNDGIIVSLDEEGGVDYSDGSTLQGRYSKVLFDNADLTFMWGEKQYELVKSNMNKENKVAVTGHPRFEMLKPECHYLYQDEVDKIKKKYKSFILINTNMSFGNNINGDDFVESNYGERFKTINKIIAFDKKKLKAYLSLIIKLAQQLNKTIVLRPHPEEDHSFYLNAFKNIDNVHVIYEGSVVPWILAATIMIHPDCTTAIEALFVGKKSISFLPTDYPPDLVTYLPLESSVCFTSESELITYIKSMKNNTQGPFIVIPFAEEYFSISKPTSELISNYIEKIKKTSNNNAMKTISLKKLLFLKLKYIKWKLAGRKNPSSLVDNKLNGFSFGKIQNINNTIAKNNSEFQEVKCKKIINQLYLFTA